MNTHVLYGLFYDTISKGITFLRNLPSMNSLLYAGSVIYNYSLAL